MFSEPLESPPVILARVMSVFSLEICDSRLLTLVTSPPTWESTVVPSAAIWPLIRSASLRKFVTVFTAWVRRRLDEGLLAAAAKLAEMSSGMLKK